MRLLPKLVLVWLLVISSWFIVFNKPVFAQENATPPNNLHNYTQQVLLDLSAGLVCQIAGIDPTGQPCLTYDLNGKLGFVPDGVNNGGAIGMMGGLISVLYTPPASTGDYFRYLADNFGIVKPAHAQGIGFQGLTPLLPIWTVFRNLAYILFVVAFVLVGFAIMLRVRIDPRTVMTIQNQIPKLIIALILVTFSYAIAGLLIDLMYVTIHLFINIAAQASPDIAEAENLRKINEFQGQSVIGWVNNLPFRGFLETTGLLGIVTAAAGGVKDLIQSLVVVTVPKPEEKTIVWPILSGIGDLFNGDFIKNVLALFLQWLGATIAFIVILIAILWALFRLWFALIQAYVYILIDVVFAPLWILVGVLPGGAMGVGAWLRDITANLAAFPTTVVMFLLAKIFIDAFRVPAGTTTSPPFIAPLIGNPGEPSAIGALIGFGIILMTPQVVNMIKEAIKAPQFKYTAAIGQAVGVGTGTLTAPAQPVISAAGFLGGQQFIKKIPGVGKWFGG